MVWCGMREVKGSNAHECMTSAHKQLGTGQGI